MTKYDYFQVSKEINPGNIEIAYAMYDYLKGLGHKCWIDKRREEDNAFSYRVWRVGQDCFGSNNAECTGIIVAASHPDIAERFRANVLAGPHKRVA